MKIDASSLMNLLTPMKVSDEAREERLASASEARVRQAQTALETLTRKRAEASEERKAIARQKIEQLKARLQMLQSMAAADPKGAARLAAQLARELGAAVKEYAAAGGTTSGGGAGPPASAPSSTDAGPGISTADPMHGDAPGEPTSAEDVTPADKDAGKSSNPYQQAMDEANARQADDTRRSSEKQADADFLGDARRIAAQLRNLIRQAADKPAGDEEALAPEEARQLRSAAADMDREIAAAQGDLGGGLSLLV